MAEKQDLKDAPVKDELQVAVSQDTSLRKVELDLDDAPFLVEQAPPPPAKTEEAPLQVADEGAEPIKKKKKAADHCSRCWPARAAGGGRCNLVVCTAHSPAAASGANQARGHRGAFCKNAHCPA